MDSASPGGSTPDVGALLRQYTGCSQCTAKVDLRRICRLAEVCKAFLRQRAMDLIAAAAGSPVLAHYSCDGTPLSTKVKLKGGSPQGFSATAEGRQTDESPISVLPMQQVRQCSAVQCRHADTSIGHAYTLPGSCGFTSLPEQYPGDLHALQLEHAVLHIV